MTGRRVVVFGPAYLDRVLRVVGPLLPGGPIDQSVEGDGKFGDGEAIAIVAPDGFVLEIGPPPGWPGPRGEIRLRGPIREGLSERREVRGIAWMDDLGGMGAGYAAAFGGVLHSALGPEDDPTSRAITDLIARYGLIHRTIRIPDRAADWTLLVTSGESGDKLPIGFRGCHAALDPEDLTRLAELPADLRVVAALPNRLAGPLLRASGTRLRFFAPALRNMADREDPLGRFGDAIDILSCNRKEWETLADRDAVADAVPIVAITGGPDGADIRFRDASGGPRRIHVPAFPRLRPPRDTNRAGEAFAAALVSCLLDHGWDGSSRVIDESLIHFAGGRAAASAALVLDRLDFGFPTPGEVEAALGIGCID